MIVLKRQLKAMWYAPWGRPKVECVWRSTLCQEHTCELPPKRDPSTELSHRENSQCRCCGDRRSPLFQKRTTAIVPGVGWTEARQGKHMEAEALWGNWEDEQGEEVETQEVAGRKERGKEDPES